MAYSCMFYEFFYHCIPLKTSYWKIPIYNHHSLPNDYKVVCKLFVTNCFFPCSYALCSMSIKYMLTWCCPYKAPIEMSLTFLLLASQEVFMALYYWFTIFRNHSNLFYLNIYSFPPLCSWCYCACKTFL
jgi:hypothetical protein